MTGFGLLPKDTSFKVTAVLAANRASPATPPVPLVPARPSHVPGPAGNRVRCSMIPLEATVAWLVDITAGDYGTYIEDQLGADGAPSTTCASSPRPRSCSRTC